MVTFVLDDDGREAEYGVPALLKALGVDVGEDGTLMAADHSAQSGNREAAFAAGENFAEEAVYLC